LIVTGAAGRMFFDQILEKVDPRFWILENGGYILPLEKAGKPVSSPGEGLHPGRKRLFS